MNADKKILARIEQERRDKAHAHRIKDVEAQIAHGEGAIAQRNVQMEGELAELRRKKGLANNNLAGATWEQSISSEMQAIVQKYKTMNDIDIERLRVLRVELDRLRSSPPLP